MAYEEENYEGRKGQKRLKALEKQIEQVNGEFEDRYADTQEMRFLKEEIKWNKKAELAFAMAYRSVSFKWRGLKDYGFIRLAKEWLTEQEIKEVDPDTIFAMARDILPTDMYSELKEEFDEKEVS